MTDIDWTLLDNAAPLIPDLRPDPFDFFGPTNEDPEHAPDLSWLWNDPYPLEWQPLHPESHVHQVAATLLGPSLESVAPPVPVAQIPSHDILHEPEFPSRYLEGVSDVQSCELGLQDVFGTADIFQSSETDEEQRHAEEDTKNNKRPRTSPVSSSPRRLKRRKAAARRSQQRRAKLSATSKAKLESSYAVNPYPDASDFAELAKHIATEEKQIRVWFNNKRNRTARNDIRHDRDPTSSSSCGPTKETFERQLANVPRIDPKSLLEKYLEVPLDEDSRIRTILSQKPDEELDNNLENASDSSWNSSWSSCGSNVSRASRRGQARSRWTTRNQKIQSYKLEKKPRNFCCTFCGQNDLKNQHQWKRHEGPCHAPQSGWICKHPECVDKPVEDNIFFRKDGFAQHFRKHSKQHIQEGDGSGEEEKQWMVETVQAKAIPADHPALSCGFCGDRLPDWDSRVKHVATHYERGADLSQWWLQRAQFVADRSVPLFSSASFHLAGPLMRDSMLCIHCGRCYLSITEAERLHPTDCTMWSCGWFEGVRAAYSNPDHSERVIWPCKYCGEVVFEIGPDYSKRLTHLVGVHSYRSCTPKTFNDVLQFRNHLVRAHRALPDRRIGELEDACSLTRKPHFVSAGTCFRFPKQMPALDVWNIDEESLCLPVDIFSRSKCGALRGTTQMRAFFNKSSQLSFIDRKFMDEIGEQLTNQYLSKFVLSTRLGSQISVVGEAVIKWIGPWYSQWKHPWLRFPPVIYVTRCYVIEGIPRGFMVVGSESLEENGLIEDDCLSVSSGDSEGTDGTLPFEEIILDFGKHSSAAG